MKVIGMKVLYDFGRQHADVIQQIRAWHAEVKQAEWQKPMDIKERYPAASILDSKRVVFNLKGNSYRLLVEVSYKNQAVRIRRIGTHAEYDKWNL